MTKLRALREAFLSEMSRLVVKHQFDGKIREQSFLRKMPFGRWAFHIAFIPHTDDVDLTADVALRFDAVEDLVNADDPALSKRARRETFTMGAELGNLAGTGQMRWTLLDQETVPAVAQSTFGSFEAIGVPYLNRYSDLYAALEALSHNDATGRLHQPFDLDRCKSATALAFVLGDSEWLERTITDSEAFLAARNASDGRAFKEFVAKLKAIQR
jgi:hypothetical protein